MLLGSISILSTDINCTISPQRQFHLDCIGPKVLSELRLLRALCVSLILFQDFRSLPCSNKIEYSGVSAGKPFHSQIIVSKAFWLKSFHPPYSNQYLQRWSVSTKVRQLSGCEKPWMPWTNVRCNSHFSRSFLSTAVFLLFLLQVVLAFDSSDSLDYCLRDLCRQPLQERIYRLDSTTGLCVERCVFSAEKYIKSLLWRCGFCPPPPVPTASPTM